MEKLLEQYLSIFTVSHSLSGRDTQNATRRRYRPHHFSYFSSYIWSYGCLDGRFDSNNNGLERPCRYPAVLLWVDHACNWITRQDQ